MAGAASLHSIIISKGGDQKITFVLHSQEPQPLLNKRRRVGNSVTPRLSPRCCSSKTASLYDLHDHQIPYEEAWAWQKDLVEEVASSGTEAGAAILLQHPPVYTLGAGSTEDHLRFDPAAPPLPLYRTERGGEVTYHGPGQLVLYPILNLRHFRQDLHWYLRSLEEVVIRALADVSGLQGERVPGLTGVWVEGQKVAAIGVRATRWVTYHGLALNVTTDLTPFKSIVPCGIADKPVASVSGLLLQQAAAEDPFAGEERLREAAERNEERLVEEYRWGLVAAAEEVLGIEWEVVSGGEALERLNARRRAGVV